MLKINLWTIVVFISINIFAFTPAIAQTENASSYILDYAIATPSHMDPAQNKIEVAFGIEFPERAVVENVNNWLVQSVGLDSGIKVEYRPVSVTVDVFNKLAILEMTQRFSPRGEIDPETHKVAIRFLQANYPSVTLGNPHYYSNAGERVELALVAALPGSIERKSIKEESDKSLGDFGLLTANQLALFKNVLASELPEIRDQIRTLPVTSETQIGLLDNYLYKSLLNPGVQNPISSLEAEKKKQGTVTNSIVQIWEWLTDHKWIFSSLIISLLAVIFLSSNLILILLQLEVEPIKTVAPLFYLTRFGRWKLYRQYTSELQKDRDVRESANMYVDLPYASTGGLAEKDQRLSELIGQSIASRRIIILADGGRGKSTLCRYIAMQVNQGKIKPHGKKIIPVIIDGLGYNGKILDAIITSLRENGAYVNSAIVEAQVLSGNLLIIFDGLSEIREAVRKKLSESSDISDFIKNHSTTPYLFTSRSQLPPEIKKALGSAAIITLKDVNEGGLRTFFRQYIRIDRDSTTPSPKELDKLIDQKIDDLIEQINSHFPTLPRIPLMLKLVATIYNETQEVPKNKTALFAEYVEWLLRPESTGVDDSAGLHFAIRHVVRETFLKNGGDRGMTVESGVRLLGGIKDDLASYGIDLRAKPLLDLFTRVGLYKQTGGNLKFFHDSFESYFAARALESDYLDKRNNLVIACFYNERLAETRSFLEAMINETGDLQRFRDEILAISPST